MKKIAVTLLLAILMASTNITVYSKTFNDADTELSETFKYALINSLRKPIDEAINEIYREDEHAPKHLNWSSYQTEIIKIRQLHGVGGLYEITLKVYPYYRAHITYGEDKIIVNTNNELVDYEHLKTYSVVDFK